MARQLLVYVSSLSVFLGLAACTSCDSNPPTKHLLPSGREVDVYLADVIEDQWHLVYRTRLRLTDEFVLAHMRLPNPAYPESYNAHIPNHLLSQQHALQCEADSLRQDVQDEAERAGVNRAVIMPTSTHWEFERFDGWYPVFSVGRSVEFTLEQNECGVWKKTVGWIEGECEMEEAAEQTAGPPGPELEIHASLFGYNLRWPTSRCCAFDLHLRPDGELSITIELESGPVTCTSRLSQHELVSLRNLVADARFFSLPEDVGLLPVDGDARMMRIRLGDRSRTVTLNHWFDDWSDASYLSQKELERTRRAHAVWAAIRALVKAPQATVP